MSIMLENRESRISISEVSDGGVLNKVTPGVYTIVPRKHDVLLESVADNYTPPDRIYGKVSEHADMIYSASKKAGGPTGVMVIGDKGNGKTLLGEVLGKKYIDDGLPVIRVDSNLSPSVIGSTIRDIGPCLVLFDEFSKVYPDGESEFKYGQENLLTLFSDGTIPGGVVFMIMDNHLGRINTFYIGRPERIYYKLSYKDPSVSLIEEILDDIGNFDDYIKVSIIETALYQYDVFGMDSILAIRGILKEFIGLSYTEFVDVVKNMNLNFKPIELSFLNQPKVTMMSSDGQVKKLNRLSCDSTDSVKRLLELPKLQHPPMAILLPWKWNGGPHCDVVICGEEGHRYSTHVDMSKLEHVWKKGADDGPYLEASHVEYDEDGNESLRIEFTSTHEPAGTEEFIDMLLEKMSQIPSEVSSDDSDESVTSVKLNGPSTPTDFLTTVNFLTPNREV